MATPPAYQSLPPSPSSTSLRLNSNDPPPNEPPPSYADATHAETAPLLSGPPPTYGTEERAYPSPRGSDTSSVNSSAHEAGERSLPEWVGQALVVFCFLAILYAFWRVIDEEGDTPGIARTEGWRGGMGRLYQT